MTSATTIDGSLGSTARWGSNSLSVSSVRVVETSAKGLELICWTDRARTNDAASEVASSRQKTHVSSSMLARTTVRPSCWPNFPEVGAVSVKELAFMVKALLDRKTPQTADAAEGRI